MEKKIKYFLEAASGWQHSTSSRRPDRIHPLSRNQPTVGSECRSAIIVFWIFFRHAMLPPPLPPTPSAANPHSLDVV